jgi:hypothetical protein
MPRCEGAGFKLLSDSITMRMDPPGTEAMPSHQTTTQNNTAAGWQNTTTVHMPLMALPPKTQYHLVATAFLST